MAKQASISSFFAQAKAKPEEGGGFLAQLKRQINEAEPGTSSPAKYKTRTSEIKKTTSPAKYKTKNSEAKATSSPARGRPKNSGEGSKESTPTKRRNTQDSNPRPSKKVKTDGPNLVQSVLDLGQKDWQKKCMECGMLYSPGNEADESCHQKFHKKFLSPLPFAVCFFSLLHYPYLLFPLSSSLFFLLILRLFSPLFFHLSSKGFKDQKIHQQGTDGSYITSISSNTKVSKHAEKIREIRNMVDEKLNFAPFEGALPEDEENYLFVLNKKILGCAIIERISTAYPIYYPKEEKEEKKEQKKERKEQKEKDAEDKVNEGEKQSGSESEDEDDNDETSEFDMMMTHIREDSPQPALIGVSRIWVHPSYRRQGIATKLVDVARKSFVYGHIVERKDVAFSQPSLEGKKFGVNFTGKRDFLVFTEVCAHEDK
eukprot:TRINITY_DN1697_c0_g1_i1.p2 TRINITY_DN1697_c0_g1~~TRINITY_DN1697_c0_g1_i1.p2  ORF type:complete len:428 (+),score=120.10 TRINITY_DN1697_c0_g1_i1:1730-3013(+)